MNVHHGRRDDELHSHFRNLFSHSNHDDDRQRCASKTETWVALGQTRKAWLTVTDDASMRKIASHAVRSWVGEIYFWKPWVGWRWVGYAEDWSITCVRSAMISGLDVFILDLRSTANTREVSAQGVEIMGEICYNLQRITMFCREIEYLKGLVWGKLHHPLWCERRRHGPARLSDVRE